MSRSCEDRMYLNYFKVTIYGGGKKLLLKGEGGEVGTVEALTKVFKRQCYVI